MDVFHSAWWYVPLFLKEQALWSFKIWSLRTTCWKNQTVCLKHFRLWSVPTLVSHRPYSEVLSLPEIKWASVEDSKISRAAPGARQPCAPCIGNLIAMTSDGLQPNSNLIQLWIVIHEKFHKFSQFLEFSVCSASQRRYYEVLCKGRSSASEQPGMRWFQNNGLLGRTNMTP